MAKSEAGSNSDAARALESEFHVFLSFRGADCRHGFADFLYQGLVDAGIRVFKDEDELQIGEVIGGNLLKVINNSIIYIPIFSQSYVSSKWCLRELVHITDNVFKSEGEKSILPIFLDVEPEDVKLKTPRYAKGLLEHANRFPDEVTAWRKALAEIDEIKGWNVQKDQSQAAIVELVIEKVLKKLEIKQKSVTEYLVGFEDRLKHLTELLDVNHHDVRIIGIYGMGGIGKTTVAKVVFNKLSSNFRKCCSFLENVRESLSTSEGMYQLQKKLKRDIVGSGSAEHLMDSEKATWTTRDSFSTEKILVALDDVEKKEHMRILRGYSLNPGSRVIITARNPIVLNEELEGEILWYEMLKMDDDPALQLFCQHAFGRELPLDDNHGLSSKIVSNLGGLPLAIEVIGSLLNGKDETFWKETLVRLREVPAEEILETLRISYDNLDKFQQQIFLDIACLLFNENKTDAIYMWADCQFFPMRGIKVLTDRCLIKIMNNDKIWMHDQLIDLGRRIVRQESPFNPGKQSRLWMAKEALEIIRTKKRKDKVQALKLFTTSGYKEITNEDFERLQNLRFLELNGGIYAGDFGRFCSNLRWFSLHSSWNFRVDNMNFNHLVVCKLYDIDFENDSKAWNLLKGAQNLKALSLTRCGRITTIPDFSKCSCLERLTLVDCPNLKRIESFIGDLRSLIELKIEECINLTDLPDQLGPLVKLKQFSMSGCSQLRELPNSLRNLTSLTELDLSDTIIREFPNSIGMLKSLRIMRLPIGELIDREHHVWQLPSGIKTLVTLEELDLYGRNEMMGKIPNGIGELSSLRILNLEHTRISGIPRTINKLNHLQTLNLRSCHEIKELPELPTSLSCLLLESKSLRYIPNLSNQTNLVELQLSDGSTDKRKSNLITRSNFMWIGSLSRLKRLELNLQNVPASSELASLSHLEELKLCCLDLESLMQLPSSNWSLRDLSTLEFYWCKMEDIPLDRLPRLKKLRVYHCKRLRRLSSSLELRKLWQVHVLYCQDLVEIQIEHLSKSLESLSIYECESLTRIGDLSYSKNLKYLQIQRCKKLTEVEGLNNLESLKSLEVTQCPSLRRLIDASGTDIPDDCLIKIHFCGHFIKDSTQNNSSRISLESYRDEIKSIKTVTGGGKKATSWREKFKICRTSKASGNK